ncbi:MAG: putative ATP-dependent ligase [Verrucomicrobiales bacterium]|nr:putative ATP-dependent ligase [Verrucomicrobiales bacterium]
MEAESVDSLPTGADYIYEPKWDGFRCLASKNGATVSLQSKAGQPLARYFPEIVAAFKKLPVTELVMDGELVIPCGDTLCFDHLLLRLHPAASRVLKLATATPAAFVVFDLLSLDGESIQSRTLLERKKLLSKVFTVHRLKSPFFLSPMVEDPQQAMKWLGQTGSSLDGIMAKKADAPYCAGSRECMQKLKLIRSADCVVGGFRYASKGRVVGSLLLGLYDEQGKLHHVGYTSSIKQDEKAALTVKLDRLEAEPGFTGRAPGGPSRWNSERSAEWVPLKPELVVEVAFDHVTGERFRHGTKLLRWRPDKAPAQCSIDQLQSAKANFKKLLKLKGSKGKP